MAKSVMDVAAPTRRRAPKAHSPAEGTPPAKMRTPKAKSLVVVESPTKARTLKKLLDRRYDVVASMGHVKDLPRSQLGVDVEHEFAPKYVVPKGKGPVIKELKAAAKKATASASDWSLNFRKPFARCRDTLETERPNS